MGQMLRYPGMSISVWQEHSRILERMISGDTDGAADLMRRHVVDANERVRINLSLSRSSLAPDPRFPA